MAGPKGPGETGGSGPGIPPAEQRGDDLDKRRRDLEAAIAARRPEKKPDDPASRSDSMAGMGYALRLSSEFIAGVVVGAAIGWFVDRMAGTSPWGLIVFLFLGFGAGVLNVLRSAGLVADQGVKPPKGE
nr:AtpZ/AtpI family protein [Mesorhizobium sp.]